MASTRSSSRRVGAAQPDDDPVSATQPDAKATQLLDEVRRLGHYPKETKSNPSEIKLARRLREAIKAQLFSPAQLQELAQLKRGVRAPQPDDHKGEMLLEPACSSSLGVGAAQPDDDCVGATQPAASSSIVAQ